jgi:uncharacterized protein (DUF885 family)
MRLLLPLTLLLVSLSASPELFADISLQDWQSRVAVQKNIDQLGQLYIEFLLEEDPTLSSTLGVHGKGDVPSYYDSRLPDVSAVRIALSREGRAFLLGHLAKISGDSLSRADQIDLHILKLQVALDQFKVERLGELTNPLTWATTLGESMSGLVLRDYAPVEQRMQSFGARCEATPLMLEQVRSLLEPDSVKPTELEKAVTLQRLQGLTAGGGLYDKTLPELLNKSRLVKEEQASILASCALAVTRINEFAAWLDKNLGAREAGNWRLGAQLYDEKYALQMDYPLDPETLLTEAETWLAVKRAELVSVGREIHDTYLASQIEAGTVRKQADLDDQQVVQDIFNRLSEDRSTTETLIADSYALADSITSFVREKDLMDLPATSKLRIEQVPPHLAGESVASIQTAPPFEPQLESVWFWDLGLLAASEDFLKEYNRASLALVYIHEGVPGHFVQLEYSNRSKRVIPRVFGNGPMVEGWATYIATQLVDAGFTVYPEEPWGSQLQQMVDDKLMLRSVINAIIDIRLQRSDWPEEEAVRMMTEQGFQEESEARSKLMRAKLSSVQLTTYFAGQLAIEKLLVEYRAQRGSAFSLKEFNERLVGAGSPPFFAIREYMLEPVK